MFKFTFNYIIVLLNVLLTAFITMTTLFDYYLRRINREKLNQRFANWSHQILRFSDIKFSVFGRENLQLEQDEKYIVMCNHTSMYDIPLAALSLDGSLRMIVKKELMQIPIWGKAMKVSDFVSIDRKNSRKAIKDLNIAKRILRKGIILWISPEGTRSKTGKLQPFKRGGFKLAMDMNAKIIPMGIRGSNQIMPAKSLKINRGQHVEVHLGNPIDVSTYNNQNRKELIARVEQEIKKLSNQL